MITITDSKVIIEFEHDCPDEVVKDMRQALISIVQHRIYDQYTDLKEVQHSNFFVLELLKHLI